MPCNEHVANEIAQIVEILWFIGGAVYPLQSYYTIKLTHDFQNKMEIPMNKSNKTFNWKLICMLMFRAHDYAGVRERKRERTI